MVTIFVWDPISNGSFTKKADGGVDLAGHASLLIGRTYISWFPEGSRLGWKWGANIGAMSAPSFATTMAEDKKVKGRNPEYVSAPITCLDEDAMLRWWEAMRPKNLSCQLSYNKDENTNYDLARLSCATIVYKALHAGGAEALVGDINSRVADAVKGAAAALGPVTGLVSQMIIGNAVAPSDVKQYAERLVECDANKKAA